MARPRPVPPYLRVMESSAWLNAEKRRLDLLRLQADAAVANGKAQGDFVLTALLQAHRNDNLALFGEFHRIAGQIHQHLAETQRIADQGATKPADRS